MTREIKNPVKDKIKKMITEHVKRMRRQMSWSGENDHVVDKIYNLLKEEK